LYFDATQALTFLPPLPSTDTNTKRETGRTAQLNNIAAAKVRAGVMVLELRDPSK
jgi:hypothetical protein